MTSLQPQSFRTASSGSHTSPRPALWTVTRVVLVLLGLFGAAAGSYFGLVAAPEDGGVSNGFDAFLAIWKVTVSLGLVAAALVPGLGVTRRATALMWLVGADMVFGLVKILGFDEAPTIPLLLVDVLLLATLWACRPRSTA